MTDETLLADLVRLAARAPSAHNTQPWSPGVVRDAAGPAVEVAVVPARTLPAGDPTSRDVLLSLGAWVECAAVGAAHAGRQLDVAPLPALRELDRLPVTGPADPDRPVLRLRLGGPVPPPAGSAPTPDDVRGRGVYRGDLDGDAGVYDDLPDGALGPGLTLRAVDPAVLRRLIRWGGIGTVADRAVAAELLRWLRLSPAHPGYDRDGLNDRVLLLPRALAAVAAPVTRRRALRDPLLAVAGGVARAADRVLRARPGPRPGSAPDRGVHHVLVLDVRSAAPGVAPERARVLDGRPGAPEEVVLAAGRALMRVWLHAHRAGQAVAPHSEAIDAAGPHEALRRHLGLGREQLPLAVFSTGRPRGEVPRSPRLPA